MIRDELIPELGYFRQFELGIPFRTKFEDQGLVVASDNDASAIHRWYRFKEGFSRRLLESLLRSELKGIGKKFRLLDPFCGSGTCLVSSQELKSQGYEIEAIGIERNPFIHFVADAKINWPQIQADDLRKLSRKLLNDGPSSISPLPALSSITTGRCISRYMARKIVDIRDAILDSGGDRATQNALMLGLASAIETVSKVRKDGRALRIKEKKRTVLSELLTKKWNQIAEDCSQAQTTICDPPLPRVVLGDGRAPGDCGVEPLSIDLIITSPPYPNNIDYTEVYKLEAWLLGFISSQEDFYELRHQTLRSHPTIARPEVYPESLKSGQLATILTPLVSRISRNEQWRSALIQAYFEDMMISLRNHFKCLRSGGLEVLIVGNSLHGGQADPILIPTDLILAEIATQIGFEVRELIAARNLRRRLSGNHFLRETMLLLRRP